MYHHTSLYISTQRAHREIYHSLVYYHGVKEHVRPGPCKSPRLAPGSISMFDQVVTAAIYIPEKYPGGII